MDCPTTATEQRLLQVLMQFKRLGLHHQAIAGCKPSEIRVLFIIKRGTSFWFNGDQSIRDQQKTTCDLADHHPATKQPGGQ